MKHQLRIPSHIQHLNEVESFIQGIIEFYALPESMHGHFMLTICESVNNAIFHGNKQDLNKHVHIVIDDGNSELQVSVADEGDGFDYLNLPDPTTRPYIRNERGRGLFLIKNLAEEVVFHNNGSTIQFKFNIKRESELLLRGS